MSKATFFRLFKREFGLTPVEYIVRERLAEAKRLLRHPLASVAEVCLRAGFNNLSYFQALFNPQRSTRYWGQGQRRRLATT